MNCITCGKKLVAGHCLCGECGKHLGDGMTQTRLGRFVQHPEELAEEITTTDAPWCKNLASCIKYIESGHFDEDVQHAKCKKCALDWLMETV